jgi:hypothetical protein
LARAAEAHSPVRLPDSVQDAQGDNRIEFVETIEGENGNMHGFSGMERGLKKMEAMLEAKANTIKNFRARTDSMMRVTETDASDTDRQSRKRRVDRARITGLLREACVHHRGDGHGRPRRQIDAAGNDDLGNADGDSPGLRHLRDHHLDSLGIEQVSRQSTPFMGWKDRRGRHECSAYSTLAGRSNTYHPSKWTSSACSPPRRT